MKTMQRAGLDTGFGLGGSPRIERGIRSPIRPSVTQSTLSVSIHAAAALVILP